MERGDHVRLAYTKWGGRPHWSHSTRFLGEDEYGTWLHNPAGTSMTRPDRVIDPLVDFVILVSPDLPATLSFWNLDNAPPHLEYALYVDMTTPAVWDGGNVTMVDLDLDVIQRLDGSVEVLDEDEFAEHQVAYDYPDDLIALARQSCEDVQAAIHEEREPYATVGWGWLAAR